MSKAIYSKEHKYLVAKLKKARMESGLSQKEAAKLLRKNQSYISKIESGQRRVDIIQLKEFAGIYKKPVNFFLK